MADNKKPFRIGLCMAGAVSAGAYTAGVMDYLIEALSEWEKRRGDDGVPSHRVTIPIMGGASAGGMTALLTASTLNNPITPVGLPADGHLLDEHTENKLYHSWVDLIDKDMFPHMLNTDDIKPGKVVSMLNSQFIDDIADKMLRCNPKEWQETPPYFEAPVKVFTTLSNLEGFSYYAGIQAGGNDEKYYMTVHNDYACFEVLDGIKQPTGAPWMPLDFRNGNYLETAKQAAMATGAFPVGLKPRILEREAKYVEKIPWLDYVFQNNPLINPSMPTKEEQEKENAKKYVSLNIDGGMINNEPFDKVRDLLNDMIAGPDDVDLSYEEKLEKYKEHNCNYNTFENTVLMVDPFPSKQAEPFEMKEDLFSVIPSTLSAMLSQMRAKPKEYKRALVSNDASRFIVSPSRYITDMEGKEEEVVGERAIACGNLAGFGGFLSKEFRIHDYYLGRANCEVFLREYFTVPESALEQNDIFKDGYANVDRDRFASNATGKDQEKQYQIIPLFTERPKPRTLKMPNFTCRESWPRIKKEEIDRFDRQLRARVEKITLNLADLSGIFNTLLRIGSKLFLNKKLAQKVLIAIKDSLYEWSLIIGYTSEAVIEKKKQRNQLKRMATAIRKEHEQDAAEARKQQEL